jgi:hypothetical protein
VLLLMYKDYANMPHDERQGRAVEKKLAVRLGTYGNTSMIGESK